MYYLLVFAAAVLAARDLYKVLGVPRTATIDQIKKKFRKRALSEHPDKHPGDSNAHARFVKLTEAYDTLSDPEKRRLYDMGEPANRPPPRPSPRRPGPQFQQGFPFPGGRTFHQQQYRPPVGNAFLRNQHVRSFLAASSLRREASPRILVILYEGIGGPRALPPEAVKAVTDAAKTLRFVLPTYSANCETPTVCAHVLPRPFRGSRSYPLAFVYGGERPIVHDGELTAKSLQKFVAHAFPDRTVSSKKLDRLPSNSPVVVVVTGSKSALLARRWSMDHGNFSVVVANSSEFPQVSGGTGLAYLWDRRNGAADIQVLGTKMTAEQQRLVDVFFERAQILHGFHRDFGVPRRNSTTGCNEPCWFLLLYGQPSFQAEQAVVERFSRAAKGGNLFWVDASSAAVRKEVGVPPCFRESYASCVRIAVVQRECVWLKTTIIGQEMRMFLREPRTCGANPSGARTTEAPPPPKMQLPKQVLDALPAPLCSKLGVAGCCYGDAPFPSVVEASECDAERFWLFSADNRPMEKCVYRRQYGCVGVSAPDAVERSASE
jgi:hypothetical protein